LVLFFGSTGVHVGQKVSINHAVEKVWCTSTLENV